MHMLLCAAFACQLFTQQTEVHLLLLGACRTYGTRAAKSAKTNLAGTFLCLSRPKSERLLAPI